MPYFTSGVVTNDVNVESRDQARLTHINAIVRHLLENIRPGDTSQAEAIKARLTSIKELSSKGTCSYDWPKMKEGEGKDKYRLDEMPTEEEETAEYNRTYQMAQGSYNLLRKRVGEALHKADFVARTQNVDKANELVRAWLQRAVDLDES